MRLIDQVNAAIATCIMTGHAPAALVIGEDELHRATHDRDGLGAFGLVPTPPRTPTRIAGLRILLSRQIGGVIAVPDDLRHTLAATGQFTVLP